MRSLSQRLIAEERRNGDSADTELRAAFRVCEKLRRPLSTLAGVGGYRSLLSRALVLSRAKAPMLGALKIEPDGSFQFSAELERQMDTPAADRAGDALTAELLTLLTTFIGEALTLRLVHEVWPRAALKDPKSGGK
jgi:hypothetical protein